MKSLTVKYNKIVTVIETELEVVGGDVREKGSNVFCINKKSDFYSWALLQEAMNVRVSQNLKGFLKKMKGLGFSCEVDTLGCFEWESNVYCSK